MTSLFLRISFLSFLLISHLYATHTASWDEQDRRADPAQLIVNEMEQRRKDLAPKLKEVRQAVRTTLGNGRPQKTQEWDTRQALDYYKEKYEEKKHQLHEQLLKEGITLSPKEEEKRLAQMMIDDEEIQKFAAQDKPPLKLPTAKELQDRFPRFFKAVTIPDAKDYPSFEPFQQTLDQINRSLDCAEGTWRECICPLLSGVRPEFQPGEERDWKNNLKEFLETAEQRCAAISDRVLPKACLEVERNSASAEFLKSLEAAWWLLWEGNEILKTVWNETMLVSSENLRASLEDSMEKLKKFRT